MSEFQEYQDYLSSFQDTSKRGEQETPTTPEQQQQVAESSGLQFSTTHNNEGELEVDFENTDNTTQPVPQEPSAAEQIESSRGEDLEYA